MQIAKVCGTVVSTQKEPSLQGVKFLLLQFVDVEGNLLADYEVAADSVGAGLDEWVLVSRGSAARQTPSGESRPLDALVIGIIDTVSVENLMLYRKRDQDR
ncbi:EutN/CcmL family microcompartment protein [Thermoleptolyngbya sichuanensis XZ-Cy5]|uniref:EutN/CcmL family microcompartment protein n=1 Tax=Thermoleptolyngbya sichuanensis TaxID=2885951 RepID=UPI00240D98DC|nr:EutN/CcmL family microcompartment protein [Thermoleptolyngbya sichuanensis]MDG2616641.1 EutN/CcmL family microcompartment protein [Thermoleptolyngbya sichuanensis XZ-Cy5]